MPPSQAQGPVKTCLPRGRAPNPFFSFGNASVGSRGGCWPPSAQGRGKQLWRHCSPPRWCNTAPSTALRKQTLLPPTFPMKITFATAPEPSILPCFDDTKKAGYPTPTTDTRGWDGRRHRRVPVPDIRHGAAFASHRRNSCLHIVVPLQGCEQPLHFHSAQQTSVSIACFGQK